MSMDLIGISIMKLSKYDIILYLFTFFMHVFNPIKIIIPIMNIRNSYHHLFVELNYDSFIAIKESYKEYN